MTSKTFTTKIVHDATTSYIPIPFDPKEVFGKLRVPVKVTLNGYTFASTIFSMRGPETERGGHAPTRGIVGIPLRRSHREAANVVGGQTLPVTLALDTSKRTVKPPSDLVKALKAQAALARWAEL